MIIASPGDYREAARRKLPPFLFHYIDGGAYDERTLEANVEDFRRVVLKQRVLKGSDRPDLSVELFGEKLDLPIVLAPVGLTGMYARRGEVQSARAAASRGIRSTLSTMSICALEEVAAAADRTLWFQLYVLRDRGFMAAMLARARAAGVTTLVFTVDLPTPGARYRDAHSGMSGPNAAARRFLQALTNPAWAWDVGLNGRPHTLGNVSHYLGRPTGLADYMGWISANFDPAIGWKDLQWVRDTWDGALIIKGILDPDDARDAVAFGADGIVVSNHGGRQLDGVLSTARALPDIVRTVKGRTRILVDSGIRSGLDVVRALALGADAVMIGRAYIYALATGGQPAVARLLDMMAHEARVAMTLTGARSISDLGQDSLAPAT